MDRKLLAVDAACLLVYQVAASPALTGVGVHEWLGLLIVAAFMTVTVSGIMVSGAVLPALGLYADGYYFWDPLHAIAAKALLALLLVHVVAHWRWLVGFFKNGKGERHGK